MSNGKNLSKRKRKPKGSMSLLANPLVWVLAGLVLLVGAFFAFRRTDQPDSTQSPQGNVDVNGAPSLKVDKEKVDLGDVPLDQTVTVTFELVNAGDQLLHFTEQPYIEVKQGC